MEQGMPRYNNYSATPVKTECNYNNGANNNSYPLSPIGSLSSANSTGSSWEGSRSGPQTPEEEEHVFSPSQLSTTERHRLQLQLQLQEQQFLQPWSAIDDNSYPSDELACGGNFVARARADFSLQDEEESEPKKKRRGRATYNEAQLRRLEAEFERCRYLKKPKRMILSSELDVPEQQIKVWFQNKRMKLKRLKTNHPAPSVIKPAAAAVIAEVHCDDPYYDRSRSSVANAYNNDGQLANSQSQFYQANNGLTSNPLHQQQLQQQQQQQQQPFQADEQANRSLIDADRKVLRPWYDRLLLQQIMRENLSAGSGPLRTTDDQIQQQFFYDRSNQVGPTLQFTPATNYTDAPRQTPAAQANNYYYANASSSNNNNHSDGDCFYHQSYQYTHITNVRMGCNCSSSTITSDNSTPQFPNFEWPSNPDGELYFDDIGKQALLKLGAELSSAWTDSAI